MILETRLQIPSESLFKGSEDQVLRRFTRSFTVCWWLLKLLCSRQVSLVSAVGGGGRCQTSKFTQITRANNGTAAEGLSLSSLTTSPSPAPSTTASTGITLHTPYVLLFHGFLILFIGNFLFDLGIKKVLTTS